MADFTHESAGFSDALERHIVLLKDGLAELCAASGLLSQQASDTVGVTLRLLLQDVVVVKHVFLCALPQEVLAVENEERLELASLLLWGLSIT